MPDVNANVAVYIGKPIEDFDKKVDERKVINEELKKKYRNYPLRNEMMEEKEAKELRGKVVANLQKGQIGEKPGIDGKDFKLEMADDIFFGQDNIDFGKRKVEIHVNEAGKQMFEAAIEDVWKHENKKEDKIGFEKNPVVRNEQQLPFLCLDVKMDWEKGILSFGNPDLGRLMSFNLKEVPIDEAICEGLTEIFEQKILVNIKRDL